MSVLKLVNPMLLWQAWRGRGAAQSRDAVTRLPIRDHVDSSSRPARLLSFDQPLVAVVLALVAFGYAQPSPALAAAVGLIVLGSLVASFKRRSAAGTSSDKPA